MATPSFRILSSALATTLLLAACTTTKQETPPLTGPSELSTAIEIAASPDVLTQDGASQSLITITARDANGQPARSMSLRTEISVEGVVTDFGTLSARNVVTDSTGRATVIYTAPPASPVTTDNQTTVQIRVTPATTNFDNATARVASIRLVPRGVIGLPPSPLRPDFSAPSPTVGNDAVFQAVVTDANGVDVTSTLSIFSWDFGDGSSASGRTVSHDFRNPGTFPVTLRITDTLGRIAQVTKSVTVLQGQVPTAAFETSPASPIIDQPINFNASGSKAEPGHSIVDFAWNFGDGTLGSGALVQHAYSQTGTYTVTLKVTDDVGRKSDLISKTITVTNGNPTADFSFNPSAPRSGQQVVFDASASEAAAGRTIVSYSWSFGNGSSGSGRTVTTTFTTGATPTTYNVLLTITDSAGRTSSVTKPITINP